MKTGMMVKHTDTLQGFPMSGLTLRPFAGEKLMLVRVEGGKGSLAPRHSHPHEQISLVVTGKVRFRMMGEERELGPGEAVHIPGGIEHEALVIEDLLMFDIFHPVREDFRDLVAGNVNT